MLTVDLLMSTSPCPNWPRERVARLLASRTVDASSWVAFARSCKRRKWRAPSLAELRLTACRYAAAHHRADVLIPWVQEVTRLRVAAQRKRHGAAATPETLAVWSALEAWDGTETQARALRDRADAEWCRTWSAAAAHAGAAAAAAAAADAADAYAAAADWKLLLSLCERLDAAMASQEAA